MKTPEQRTDKPKPTQGFALVAVMITSSLLLLLALACISLATVTSKITTIDKHQQIARSQARLALQLALAQLQEELGPDTRVSANASIIQNHINPHWLGTWDTTIVSNNQPWPLIGKKTNTSPSAPYTTLHAYSDLRHTRQNLANNNWKQQLHRKWLVSNNGITSPAGTIEILSTGTLGNNPTILSNNKVTVPKQKTPNGAIAWWTSDNNQKASLRSKTQTTSPLAELDASQIDNPTLITQENKRPFKTFNQNAAKHPNKILTYRTTPLTQETPQKSATDLGSYFNHFTTNSQGLFINTLLGTFKQDLTPLLLANKSTKTITLQPPISSASSRQFSSALPIIPGSAHDLLGPSFDALRNWALLTYDLPSKAQTTFPPNSTRTRPSNPWPHVIADGVTANAADWAAQAPKIHPIMTDTRWHYYFSHQQKNFRTHIIPRVCLWNPYNITLNTEELVILMPNPFYKKKSTVNFYISDSEVKRLKNNFPKTKAIQNWIKKPIYKSPPPELQNNPNFQNDVFKLRVEDSNKNLLPNQRFLAFTLDPTELDPGECHVFSPRPQNPSISASGITIQEYNPSNPSANRLSSSEPQGENHFYFDYINPKCETRVSTSSRWNNAPSAMMRELRFEEIIDFSTELNMNTSGQVDNFPFILKAAKTSPTNLSHILTSDSYPTLQLILANAAGGAAPTTFFAFSSSYGWPTANIASPSFDSLQTFQESPRKEAPSVCNIGAKLLWLDESQTEALNPPLRAGRWTPDHMAYNPATIANWNIRAQLTTRSPASQVSAKWYMTSTGPWLLQLLPKSPQNFNDQPSLNSKGHFIKNPLSLAVNQTLSPNLTLFDLPSEKYGILSLTALRHASLTPYSWHPSYIIGQSIRDLHAPSNSTAHPIVTEPYTATFPKTSWDFFIGGMQSTLKHGGYTKEIDSQGLLQIGAESSKKIITGLTVTSEDDILTYDIAFETNHNLYDRFFLSSMPLTTATTNFDWSPSSNTKQLTNSRYTFNPNTKLSAQTEAKKISKNSGISDGFWNNAYLLHNQSAFNVNSTSIPAWTAFLSGTIGVNRPLKNGTHANGLLTFARYRSPEKAGASTNADPDSIEGWTGLRQLEDEEVRTLATAIVKEIKLRGPFISVADFVNRRLSESTDPTSHRGTIDAAILKSGLNNAFFRNPEYQTSTINAPKGSDAPDNNHPSFKNTYLYQHGSETKSYQPASQAWGLPGYLTQSDILDPLTPSITVRGDTFTIRAYGEAFENNQIVARAFLEATIERTPNYLEHKSLSAPSASRGNYPTAPTILLEPLTGDLTNGNLTSTNKKFGRRFTIKSFRWLTPQEI